MKKFFKLNNIKRLIILGSTLLGAILTIVFGSIFYVAGNVRKSPEFGGAAEFLVNINADKGTKASDIANDVASSIGDRLDPLGVNGVKSAAEIYGDEAMVRVTYPAIDSEEKRTAIEDSIVHKPQLVLTDIYGNPLFTGRGTFRQDLTSDPNGFVPFNLSSGFTSYSGNTQARSTKDLFYRDSDKMWNRFPSSVPIANNGANVTVTSSGTRQVQITLASNSASHEWTNATRYLSKLPKGKNVVLAWLDPQVMYSNIYNAFKDDATVLSSQNNLYNFVHIGQNVKNPLRKNTVPVEDYLISRAAVSKILSGRSFVIEGNFSPTEALNLARKINYGVSSYSLTSYLTLNQQTASYGENAFKLAIIAGAVVFSLIALILIVNYGLLGALSTISVALFVFLTLCFFTVMRGEYSPASIAALVIGIGMSVDAVIVTFERLKSEIYAGSSLNKAFKISQRKSLTTIFDSNVTTLIVATVLFYFGTRSIIGLSVTLILSIIFTMLIMLLLTRFLSALLVRSELIKTHKWLLGAKPKFDTKLQSKINSMDYMKNTKWFSSFSFVIMIAGFVVFIIFASIGSSFSSGFNLSQEFTGGISISVKSTNDPDLLANIKTTLIGTTYGIDSSSISINGDELVARSTLQLDDTILNQLRSYISSVVGNSYSVFRTTTAVASKMVKDSIYAVIIAMAFIVVYTVIRFKWTYSIASLIALAHDALMVTLFFVIFRLSIEPIFVAAILTTIGYSINDTIVTFDRVREKMLTHVGEKNKKSITAIANNAIRDTLKRSLLTSATTMLAIIVLMCFGHATKLEYNIAMLVGLVSGTYSSIFIATWVWVKLESWRQERIRSRAKKGFWDVKGVEEQTLVGINDFNV